MNRTSAESLTLSHGSNGIWEGTFQVVLNALLDDILSDGPADVSLTLADSTEVHGRLLSFDDSHIELDTVSGGLHISRDTILAFTLE